MTAFQDEIDLAYELIEENGREVVLRRDPESPETTSYDEADFGTLTASGDELIFSDPPADLSAVFSVGDRIEFREVSAFANRGPFEVTAITSEGVKVDASLSSAIDTAWFMDVTTTAFSFASGVALSLPPQSFTKQSFEQAFRDGTLQVSRALDLLLAAYGLDFDPLPGDKLQFDRAEWSDSANVWVIHGIGPLAPDGTAIIWQGVITKG